MKKLIEKLFVRASEALGTWEAFEVVTPADRAACMAVLERVRRDELNRMAGGSALQSAAFAEREVPDRLFAVRHARTGEIVGCTRGIDATHLADIPDSRKEYGLDLIPEALLRRTAVATRLVILPEHRRTMAGLSLLTRFYEEGFRGGYELCLLACEPGLYSMYVQLGFRPLGRCHASPTGGFRIPMVMVSHDIAHLRAVGSPLVRVAERVAIDPASGGVAWYRALQRDEQVIDPGIRAYANDGDGGNDQEPVHGALTRGMSAKGVDALLQNALVVPCELGQKVVREGDGGRQIGVVVDGLLEVVVDDRVVAMLAEGEVFGEIAFALQGRRSADLRAAAPDTTVLLLSQRSVDRIADPADAVAFWRNLSALLARRLRVATRRIATDRPSEAVAEGT